MMRLTFMHNCRSVCGSVGEKVTFDQNVMVGNWFEMPRPHCASTGVEMLFVAMREISVTDSLTKD